MEFWYKLWRTKSLQQLSAETCLNRCLSIFDLVVLGFGSMVGSGIYIMAGITAKEQSGPSVLLSFVVTMPIVVLIAACFTELAARLHKTGSVYLYLYLTVGELPAFLAGFFSLISGVLGGGAMARAWSSYVDFLFHGAISNYTETHMAAWNIGPPIARYPDVMAVVVIIVINCIVGLGVQYLFKFSALFALLNVFVLVFSTACGFTYGHLSNWSDVSGVVSLLNETNATNTSSLTSLSTGFFPFGWSGTLQGVATCFWAFSGFESISCAVEESRNPRRDIPIATVVTLTLVTILYLSATAALTLLMPYNMIDVNAPLPSAALYAGLTWAHFVLSIGPLCGLTTAILGITYGFIRMGLAMAEDGLLFKWFARVNSWTRAPVLPVVVCGVLESIVAFAFEIQDLIVFGVSVLLLTYLVVCVCVIMLRYRRSTGEPSRFKLENIDGDENALDQPLIANDHAHQDFQLPVANNTFDDSYMVAACRCLEPMVVCKQGRCVSVALLAMLFSMLLSALVLVYLFVPLEHGVWWAVSMLVVTAFGAVLSLGFISAHRQALYHASLQIPCVPLVPSAAAFACLVLLVVNSTLVGWIGFIVLLVPGVVLYFTYSIRHSNLNTRSSFLTMVDNCRSFNDDDDDDEVDTFSLLDKDCNYESGV